MQQKATELAQFLGPRAHRIVSMIPDPELMERVSAAIQACAETLRIVDGIDLSPHELADLETPNVAAWNALAPDVRNLLVALRGVSDYLSCLFPVSEDRPPASDGASFDFALGDPAAGLGMDDIVRVSTSKDPSGIGEGVRLLGDVLKKDIIALGGRLRNPQVVGDRWFLLAELHQFLSQCGQCLEAIVATVLGAVTSERLDEVLPRYLNETQRAARLRAAVAELYYEVELYNESIARAQEEELPILWSALVDTLNDFSGMAAYKQLKPQDKRAVIMFRISLNSWEKNGSNPERLRQEVEGFSKFLALACDMNWRDVLAEHDRRTVWELREHLATGVPVDVLLPELESLYGRNPMLDGHIRDLRRRMPVSTERLIGILMELG